MVEQQGFAQDRPWTGPFQELLGYTVHLPSSGPAEVRLVLDRRHLSQYGIAHGGVALSLLDTVGGIAVLAAVGSLDRLSTVSLSVDFTRPVRPGPVRAIGWPVRIGRVLAQVRMELHEEDGKKRLLAQGQGVYRLFRADGVAAFRES